MKKTKYISMQDEYMQMLLHLNEDFDDDFLLDAMNQLLFGVSEWLPCFINIFPT